MKIRQGHFVEGERLASQAVEMHRRLHGDLHPETAFGLRTLARALAPQQKLVEAEAADREALVVFRHQFPESHPNIRESMYHLRTVLEARDDKAALDALAKQEAEIEMRSNSPDYRIRLAGALLANTSQQRRDEARQLIRHAINEYAQVAVDYPNDLDRRANALVHCARALWPSAAVPGFEDEVAEVNRRMEVELPKLLIDFPDSNDSQWRTAVTYREWGNALFNCSTYLPVAERAMSEGEKILGKLSLSDPKRPRLWPQLADTYSVLGEIQWRSGRLQEAAAAFRRGMEIHDEHAAEIANASDAPGFIFVSCQRLAYFLAATHREEEAAKVARRAAQAAVQMKTPLEKLYGNHLIAIAQLRAGDDAGYRATCKALAEVPVDDVDDLMKARQILTFCIAPNSLEDMDLVVERAEELAKHNQVDEPHIVPYALGAALYRDGQYDRAAEQLEKSIAAYPSDPWIDCETINLQRLLLAMSKWQLDKKDEARRLLAETKPAIDQEIQSPSVFYVLKATLEVLRREAEALIEPNEINDAVENESPTRDEPKE
jgi:tetratricopeptide (TPR) repeat protein